jgi:hypothetical protein
MNMRIERWSTANAPGRSSLEYWNELLREKFIGLHVESQSSNEFTGRLSRTTLGETDAFMISASERQHVIHAADAGTLSPTGGAFILIHMRSGWLDLYNGGRTT